MPAPASELRQPARVVGVLLAGAGAVAYGVATVIGRGLADAGVDSATALGVRFSIAAVLLAALLVLRGAPLRPLRGEWGRIVALGAFGYTLESTLFYLSLERGTAAACVLLFYAYPAIVAAIEFVRGTERPTRAAGLALALSGAGTAVVVAAGSNVSISRAGVLLALGSAAAYAVYLVIGRGLGRRTGAMTAACWVAVGAAAASLTRGISGGTLAAPDGHVLALLGYGGATAAAFALTFAALSRIGASQTAVIGTLEAGSAVALAAIFLHESISAAQALGGAAIIAAAMVIAWSHRDRPSPPGAPRPGRRPRGARPPGAQAPAATPLRSATSATMSRMIAVKSKSFGV